MPAARMWNVVVCGRGAQARMRATRCRVRATIRPYAAAAAALVPAGCLASKDAKSRPAERSSSTLAAVEVGGNREIQGLLLEERARLRSSRGHISIFKLILCSNLAATFPYFRNSCRLKNTAYEADSNPLVLHDEYGTGPAGGPATGIARHRAGPRPGTVLGRAAPPANGATPEF